MPGVEVSVDEECIGCGTCIDVCFVKAIEIKDEKSVTSEACRGCGRCVEICLNNAIDLTLDNDEYVKLSVDRIEPLVDVE